MAKRKTAPPVDRAAEWVRLWSICCPPDLRHLETRDKQHGGEYQFARKAIKRNFRFDWCIPQANIMVAVEVDGGNRMAVWSQKLNRCVVIGRHNQDADLARHNAAEMLGWHVFHFSPQMLSPTAVDVVVRLIRDKLNRS